MMLSEIIAALWGCTNPTYMNIERIKTFDLNDMHRHRCTFEAICIPIKIWQSPHYKQRG